ncbi:Mnd1 family-domain-containing protein [Dichotomocladium elegans]|nr:Mnd1 family-domain-containing protein [Dichotomocladium elegans]
MSRKGVSLEEKRRRIEKYLQESGDFFQLKELEKIGPKVGVVSQSVKDVVQSLVDDGLVSTDKIATSNYFWSFPSTAYKIAKKNALLKNQIQEAQRGREPSEERDQVLAELAAAESEQKTLQSELQQYIENDPEIYKAKEKAISIAKEAANRWTENIWTLQSYCVNKFGMDRRDFDKSFGIHSEFDTIP